MDGDTDTTTVDAQWKEMLLRMPLKHRDTMALALSALALDVSRIISGASMSGTHTLQCAGNWQSPHGLLVSWQVSVSVPGDHQPTIMTPQPMSPYAP